jgi:hypothetical protein
MILVHVGQEQKIDLLPTAIGMELGDLACPRSGLRFHRAAVIDVSDPLTGKACVSSVRSRRDDGTVEAALPDGVLAAVVSNHCGGLVWAIYGILWSRLLNCVVHAAFVAGRGNQGKSRWVWSIHLARPL